MLTTPTLQSVPTAAPSSRRLPWEVVATAGAAAIALFPLLLRHAAWLWQRPHYQFFPFVLVGVGVLAYTRLRTVSAWRPGAVGIVAASLAAAWVLVLGADVLASPWLGCIAGLVLLLTLAYAAGGRPACRQALPAWALLWLVVPPPLDLDRTLVFELQNLTTAWSSAVLDVLGVFHVRAGNVIEVDGKQLLVEQACSGVNSLFSLLACTLFLVLLTRRGWVRGSLLVAAAVGWVLVANVGRVSGVVWLDARWGLDVSTGWRHELFGFLLFAVAVGLLLSSDQLFLFLTRSPNPAGDNRRISSPSPLAGEGAHSPDESRDYGRARGESDNRVAAPATLARVPRPVDRRAFRRIATVGVPAYLLLAVASWGPLSSQFGPSLVDGPATAPEREGLPKTIESWEQIDFATHSREANSFYGERSCTWMYATPRLRAVVSLDFPFPGWHDLSWCYTARGWTIDQWVRTDQGVAGECVGARMTQPTHRYGYLLFGEFDRHGQPLAARPGGVEASFFRHQAALQRVGSWFGLDRPPDVDPGGPIYQLQVFWEGFERPTAEDEADLVKLFARSGEVLRESYAGKR